MTDNKIVVFIQRYHLALILAVAFSVRVAAAFYFGNEVTGLSGANDEITYDELGWRYATGHGMTFPTGWYPWIKANAPQSYFSFGFSWMIAQIYTVFGRAPLIARLIFACMSTLIVFMIYVIADRLYGVRAAAVSAAIASVYAYLIFYGVSLVTETPFTLLLLLAIYVAFRLVDEQRWWLWVLMGLLLTGGIFMRTTMIFFVPLVSLWLIWRMQEKWRAIWLSVPALIIVLSLIPFIQRNDAMWGEFGVLEAQFGHVFWNGNHPDHEGDFHPFIVFDIPEEVLALDNDILITNTLLQMGIENVRNNPSDFMWLTVTRLREMFTFWPTADSTLTSNVMRVLSFGILVPFALVGLVMGAHKWRSVAPIYLFILAHAGIHAVTWSMIRYRVSLDTFFIIFASLPVCVLVDYVAHRFRATRVMTPPTLVSTD